MRLAWVLVVLALLVPASVAPVRPAAAQTALQDSVAQRPRPEFDPAGIPFGPRESFLLLPRLDIKGEYTDNLFKTETGKIADEIVILNPRLDLRSDWDRHALNLRADASYAAHADNPSEDWFDYELGGDGRLDVADLGHLALGAAFKRGHEDRGSPDDVAQDNPTRLFVGTVRGRALYNPGLILLRLDGTARRTDFRDAGVVNNDDRDRLEVEGRLRVGYERVPGSTAFVEGAYNVRDFDQTLDDNGFKRSSDGYEILVGNTLDLSGVTFLELAVGYRDQAFDDPALSNAEGFSFAGRLIWNPTDLATVTARVRRLIKDTTIAGASSIVASIASLRLDYDLLDNVILDGGFLYEKDDFEGINRDEDLWVFDFGGRYLLGPYLSAGARYRLESRDSNIAGDSFTENSVRVFIRGQI